MNSVQTVTPKQCTVTKLGRVHSAHTQNPGRAHTACSTQFVGAAASTAGRSRACRAHSQCMLRAGRDTSRQPTPGRDLTSMSRHQDSQSHVATSNQCRDTTQTTPGHDLKTGLRLRFSCPTPSQVATSFPGRDLLDDQARS